jgi:excisionase family DNA binding protein
MTRGDPPPSGSNLTIIEVATIVRCSTKTVRRMVGDGRLPAFRFGGQWRIRKADLERFLMWTWTGPEPAQPAEPTETQSQYREDV